MVKYIIQPGDTLHFIALKFGTSVNSIMECNRLSNPHNVYPGQALNIPLLYRYMQMQGPASLPILKKNDKGPLVILMQTMLSSNDFPSIKINGIYDSYTEACVSHLQASWKMPITGNVNQATWKILLDDTVTTDTPPYDCLMIKTGVLLILSTNKPIYKACDTIDMSLVKMNLSQKSTVLNYNSGQRYDFGIAYSNGRILWRWSDDKSFTQATGD